VFETWVRASSAYIWQLLCMSKNASKLALTGSLGKSLSSSVGSKKFNKTFLPDAISCCISPNLADRGKAFSHAGLLNGYRFRAGYQENQYLS